MKDEELYGEKPLSLWRIAATIGYGTSNHVFCNLFYRAHFWPVDPQHHMNQKQNCKISLTKLCAFKPNALNSYHLCSWCNLDNRIILIVHDLRNNATCRWHYSMHVSSFNVRYLSLATTRRWRGTQALSPTTYGRIKKRKTTIEMMHSIGSIASRRWPDREPEKPPSLVWFIRTKTTSKKAR